ncbi:MAG: LysR family transcriptional regulator [Parachlamydia sp.]|jgi:DNA-binding transcriptional LysR family regulator|nr:LysR family transcriptional regulator [Parachlamydia sp.]
MNQSLKNLRIADLELFITAAHLKNLGRSAALHSLSQSAASSAIQRVEIAFGRPLCTHEKRQFRLTKEGQLLLPRAENWVQQLRDTVAKQDPLPIRIATTHAIARVAIAPILTVETIELKLMRPDRAYGAVLRDEADIALVLDNALWEGVIAAELGKGSFQLYSTNADSAQTAVLLPEDQMEVLALQQRWGQVYSQPLMVKARLPSWSLIADICSTSSEVGFLPDFLAQQFSLHPVGWQPTPSRYRILALYRGNGEAFQQRLNQLVHLWKKVFTS